MGGGEEDSNGGDDGEGGEGYQTKPVKKNQLYVLYWEAFCKHRGQQQRKP